MLKAERIEQTNMSVGSFSGSTTERVVEQRDRGGW